MAIVMKEFFDSRQRTATPKGSAELRYWVEGSDDDEVVTDYVLDHAPAEHAGWPLIEPFIEPMGPGLWRAILKYGPPSSQNQVPPTPPPQLGDSEVAWSSSGGTQHITQALDTVATYIDAALTPAASDWGKAIGVQEDSVEGIDVVVRQFMYEETHQISAAAEPTVRGACFALTGKTNHAAWKGFAAGEVLFLGGEATLRTEGFWTIKFRFACLPNATGLVVGGITGIAKKGHEYLDVEYQNREDATAGMVIRKPVAVRIQKVYESGNFASLGIGT